MAMIKSDGTLVWNIPASINLPALLEKHSYNRFRPNIDHLYFILDYLGAHMEFQDLDENEGFVNLNAKKLQSYNQNYERYIRYLKERGIIHTDNRFIKGKKSRGYAVKESLYTDKSVQIPVERFTLRRRLRRELKKYEQNQQKCEQEYGFLTKWFNDRLQIDPEGAMETVNQLFPLPNRQAGLKGTAKGLNRMSRRYKAIQAIERIKNSNFYYSVDENIGRFHSNLTNIKKDLRKHITYNGERLVNADIPNAQPLFSSLLLKEAFWKGQMDLSINKLASIKSLFKSSRTYNKFINNCLRYITLHKSAKMQVQQEFQEFSRSVQEGAFYPDAFQRMFPQQAYSKEKVKQAIFQTFFSSNRFMGQKTALPKKLFSLAYPAVYQLFRMIKKDNHVVLSHLLQRIESTIMIEHVAKRIAREKPELPFYTIHDSVLTTQGNEQFVKEIMEEEIYRLTGLNCNVRLEGNNQG